MEYKKLRINSDSKGWRKDPLLASGRKPVWTCAETYSDTDDVLGEGSVDEDGLLSSYRVGADDGVDSSKILIAIEG